MESKFILWVFSSYGLINLFQKINTTLNLIRVSANEICSLLLNKDQNLSYDKYVSLVYQKAFRCCYGHI